MRTRPGMEGMPGIPGYFDLPNGGNGSIRLEHLDKRRSRLGSLATPGGLTNYGDEEFDDNVSKGRARGRCCWEGGR